MRGGMNLRLGSRNTTEKAIVRTSTDCRSPQGESNLELRGSRQCPFRRRSWCRRALLLVVRCASDRRLCGDASFHREAALSRPALAIGAGS
jgi:hypothetical protein